MLYRPRHDEDDEGEVEEGRGVGEKAVEHFHRYYLRVKKLLSALFISLATACATTPPQPVHVVIVGTTDLHGWLNGHDEKVPYGGPPLLASYIDDVPPA